MALVELRSCENRIEGAILQSALAAEGIDSFLFDAEMSWVGGLLPCRLMVDEAELDDAQRILDQPGENLQASSPSS